MNPYRNIKDYCFWSRVMTAVPPGRIDPVSSSAAIIPSEVISTMGSCFAQHLGRHLNLNGMNILDAEPAPAEMSEVDRKSGNYGVFSARYGNIYTVRQALQLFDRALGSFAPIEDVWEHEDGSYVDAFRPQISAQRLSSVSEVKDSALRHLAAVRRVFLESNWLIFTLGLTEGWRSRLDGAVYPLAPGVAAGSFDPSRHEFVNFSVAETISDLNYFIDRVRSVNPSIKILLTVSPVPLIATYENRHALVSTTVSKSILRVAADEAERRYKDVYYFPSYEIITSAANGGKYMEDDLRQVKDIGVKHVMRVFSDHFLVQRHRLPVPAVHSAGTSFSNVDIVCDEETIENALTKAGFAENGLKPL